MTKTIALKQPPSPLLAEIAAEALAAHGIPGRALATFVSEIRDAGGLANDLIDDETLRFCALEFLEKIAGGGSR
jgi:hypothetical protein